MKKVVLRSFILLIITILLFYYILKDNFSESIRLLTSSNLLFVLLGFLMCLIAFLIDTHIFKTLIRRHNKKGAEAPFSFYRYFSVPSVRTSTKS